MLLYENIRYYSFSFWFSLLSLSDAYSHHQPSPPIWWPSMYIFVAKRMNLGAERERGSEWEIEQTPSYVLIDMSSCLQFIVTHYYIIYITHVTHEPYPYSECPRTLYVLPSFLALHFYLWFRYYSLLFLVMVLVLTQTIHTDSSFHSNMIFLFFSFSLTFLLSFSILAHNEIYSACNDNKQLQ